MNIDRANTMDSNLDANVALSWSLSGVIVEDRARDLAKILFKGYWLVVVNKLVDIATSLIPE